MLPSLSTGGCKLGISVFLASSGMDAACQAFSSFLLQLGDLSNCEATGCCVFFFSERVLKLKSS